MSGFWAPRAPLKNTRDSPVPTDNVIGSPSLRFNGHGSAEPRASEAGCTGEDCSRRHRPGESGLRRHSATLIPWIWDRTMLRFRPRACSGGGVRRDARWRGPVSARSQPRGARARCRRARDDSAHCYSTRRSGPRHGAGEIRPTEGYGRGTRGGCCRGSCAWKGPSVGRRRRSAPVEALGRFPASECHGPPFGSTPHAGGRPLSGGGRSVCYASSLQSSRRIP